MGSLAAGRMTQKVSIYKNVPTVNADGQPVEVPTLVATRWAEVLPMTGRERYYAQQVQSTATWKVTMRHDTTTDDIDATYWLVTAASTRLNITRVCDPDQRSECVELECQEGAA